MKIGIVSNSKICIPLLSYLISYNKAGVLFYLGNSQVPEISRPELLGFCNANRIAVHLEDKKEELYQWQQFFEPDIIFVTGYSHKIQVEQLSGVSKGIYNIHFGKLPEFRGPSPVFWQLKKGLRDIGLSIHQLSDKLDSGAVVWEYFLKNEDYHSYNYVNYIFSEMQVQGVAHILEHVYRNEIVNKKPQDENKAKYFKKPQLADVMINWETMGANEITSLVKACNSWNIGAITGINGAELKIIDATAAEKNNDAFTPGTAIVDGAKFHVVCLNQQCIAINFFYMNNTYVPARHAGFYGLKTGQRFINP
ncbi:hypothetical protein BH09BAC6_BH09BAC6_28270 [soil metagenome]